MPTVKNELQRKQAPVTNTQHYVTDTEVKPANIYTFFSTR